MKTSWLRTVLLISGVPCWAFAQSTLTLEEAIAQALQGHPLLTAGAERVTVAEGHLRQAALRYNPRLVLQQENTRFGTAPPNRYWREADSFVYLQQTVETGNRRDLRAGVAAQQVKRAELERELTSKHIVARVKHAYWIASGAQAVRRLLKESRDNFGRIIEFHEARVREGAMAEADLLRVRLEGERLNVAINAALLESQRSRIDLFREMGRTEFPEVTMAGPLDGPAAPPMTADADRALAERTELKLGRTDIERSRASLRLQQAQSRPNVDALLGYKRTQGLNTLIGGVQFDLPLSNRNQGNIEMAAAEIRVAEANLAASSAVVRAEVAAAQREIEIRQRQLTGVLVPMLGQARQSAEIARAAYMEGGADLLRLLDSERVRLETEILYVRTLAEYRQSLAAIEAAMGVNP